MNNTKIINKNKYLTSTEQYLVDFINKNPQSFIEQTSKQIAKQANVSPSALTRLTKKLGYSNLKALQIMVAMREQELKHNSVGKKSTLKNRLNNLKSEIKTNLDELVNQLDLDKFELLIEKINNAKKIFLFQSDDNQTMIGNLTFYLEQFGFDIITNPVEKIQLLKLTKLSNHDLVIIFSNILTTSTIFFLKKTIELGLNLIIISDQKTPSWIKKHGFWFNWKSNTFPLNWSEIDQTIFSLIFEKILFQELEIEQKTSMNKSKKLLQI